MKEKYFKPFSKISVFQTVDVIATSTTGDIQDDDNIVDGSDGW